MLHRPDKRKWARANFVELNHLWWEKGGGAGIGNGNTKQDSGLERVGARADYSLSTRHHQSFLEPALLAGALTTFDGRMGEEDRGDRRFRISNFGFLGMLEEFQLYQPILYTLSRCSFFTP